MKRTRRIEITRYRRTVTVTQGNEDLPDPEADQSALEVAANAWEIILPTDEVEAEGVLKVVRSDELPALRRWSSFNFRNWLRQRF